jgi:hypothetical protein
VRRERHKLGSLRTAISLMDAVLRVMGSFNGYDAVNTERGDLSSPGAMLRERDDGGLADDESATVSAVFMMRQLLAWKCFFHG